jgi:hypothetical protein
MPPVTMTDARSALSTDLPFGSFIISSVALELLTESDWDKNISSSIAGLKVIGTSGNHTLNLSAISFSDVRSKEESNLEFATNAEWFGKTC